MELTQELVKDLFDYRDGFLYWKNNRGNNKIKAGDKCGYLNKRNYYIVKINQKCYRQHRIIFLYYHGYLPKMIDHIDGNSMNNDIRNLREITNSQNQANSKLRKNTSSQYKGVCKRKNKYEAQIIINGKLKYLGLFINESDAALAYNKVAIKYFGEYSNLNEVR